MTSGCFSLKKLLVIKVACYCKSESILGWTIVTRSRNAVKLVVPPLLVSYSSTLLHTGSSHKSTYTMSTSSKLVSVFRTFGANLSVPLNYSDWKTPSAKLNSTLCGKSLHTHSHKLRCWTCAWTHKHHCQHCQWPLLQTSPSCIQHYCETLKTHLNSLVLS